MKRFVVLTLLLATLLTIGVIAQSRFMGIYWIIGSVADPDSVGVEGRKVVFYKDDPSNGFSDELTGVAGLGGIANQYRLNAFEDWRMVVAPDKYKVAIVNDNQSNKAAGYGADPVEVSLTGYGYDRAPQLVLMLGAGIKDPGDRPDQNTPRFDYIKYGNRLYQKALVAKGQEFIVAAKPRITARVLSPVGLKLDSMAMVLNDGTVSSKTYSIKAANVSKAAGPADAPTDVTFTYDFAGENQDALPDGTQKLTFKAANIYGVGAEIQMVTVAGGEPRLIGVPITFPSPLNLLKDREVFIQYTMSQDINVDIHMLDVSGREVKKFVCNAGQEGGSAGVNKITWNLITEQGSKVSSGIYVFTIISRDNQKMLGKGKFTAVTQ